MTKIPVLRTIADAYRFAFLHLGKVIGLIWLPIIILTVLSYAFQIYYLSVMPEVLESGDFGRIGPLYLAIFGFGIVSLILLAMISVAITREILNPLKRPLPLRFALGPAELRVVGGYIGVMALMVIFALGVVLLSVLAGVVGMLVTSSGGLSKIIGSAAGGLVGLIGLCALIYVVIRLFFLLVPSAVMEGKFGIERSWELTKGNFWRIILISLAVGLPVALMMLGVEMAILGPDMLNPHLELAGDKAAQMRHTAEQLRLMIPHMPVLLGIRFVLAPFIYGLTVSPAAFAYAALTGRDVPRP